MIHETLANIPAAQLAAFLSAGVMLNLAPGPDVMFATASGIRGGPRAGVLAALGIALGIAVYVVALTLGLGAAVAAYPALLDGVRYAGAAYLLYLGWRAWTAPPAAATTVTGGTSGAAIVRRALVANLLNPKPPLFLLSFLPQFMRPEYGPVWQQLLALGLIFCATGFAITAGYGIAAGWLGLRFGGRLGGRLPILNRIAALMFAGLAARLALK